MDLITAPGGSSGFAALTGAAPTSTLLPTPPSTLPAPMPALGTGQHRAPFIEALRAWRDSGTVPFTTPGHKLGEAADPDLVDLLGREVFRVDTWLNTREYARTLGEAQRLAAEAWGADRSWFLMEGSSSGTRAFLLATLRPGDEVVVARDMHTSLLAALVLTGAKPVYVTPRLHSGLDIGVGIAPADVAAALVAHPAAKLVVVVSPSYLGVASDLAGIARVAHARNVPLYVDEAWGPHFPFHPNLPASAMASGADAAVTSAHKMLSALSQGSLLHARAGRIDLDRLATTVVMSQTTSPLLPVLASLDACRRQMAVAGEAWLERALALARLARRRLRQVPGLSVLDAEALGLPRHGYDPTKLVIDVHGLGLTGFAVEAALRGRFGVAPEMSDLASVMCLVTGGDTPASIDRLVQALATLAREQGTRTDGAQIRRACGGILGPGRQVLTPREAFFAKARAVPLAEAAGEVAAEMVTTYPPGIPVLMPGEAITAERLEYLRESAAAGSHICGAADPRLATVRVVTDTRRGEV